MTSISNEPVEISTRMRQGEWTPESLEQLVASYQQKLVSMGAPAEEILTDVETLEDGSTKVHVSWPREGTQTFGDDGHGDVPEAANSRGQGEQIAQGETTKDSQGLGAILGDADRSAIDEPSAGG